MFRRGREGEWREGGRRPCKRELRTRVGFPDPGARQGDQKNGVTFTGREVRKKKLSKSLSQIVAG